MELTGKVIDVLDELSGQTKQGKEWRSREFAIEYTDGSYQKTACFKCMGKALDHVPDLEDVVTVSFTPESREYNGKYYTTLTAWKVVVNSQPEKTYERAEPETTPKNKPTQNDLPF